MSSSGAVTLGNIADKLPMLEVACSRCERRGRLSVVKLIERDATDAKLTDLWTILAGDCTRIGGAIYEQCSVHHPQLVRLWRGEPPDGRFRRCCALALTSCRVRPFFIFPARNPSSTADGDHSPGGDAMVTMLLRVFNAWTWVAILVSATLAYHAWEQPEKLLSGVVIMAVLCFALDRVIKRSERVIATVWNEPS